MRVEKYYYSDNNKPNTAIENTEKFQSFTSQNSLSLAAKRQSSSLNEGACPLCRFATSLPKGETS